MPQPRGWILYTFDAHRDVVVIGFEDGQIAAVNIGDDTSGFEAGRGQVSRMVFTPRM